MEASAPKTESRLLNFLTTQHLKEFPTVSAWTARESTTMEGLRREASASEQPSTDLLRAVADPGVGVFRVKMLKAEIRVESAEQSGLRLGLGHNWTLCCLDRSWVHRSISNCIFLPDRTAPGLPESLSLFSFGGRRAAGQGTLQAQFNFRRSGPVVRRVAERIRRFDDIRRFARPVHAPLRDNRNRL